MEHLEDDPGWRFSPRMLLFLVPGYLQLTMRDQGRQRDGLEILRQVWVSFTMAQVLIGVVVIPVTAGMNQSSAMPWLALLAAAAAALLGAQSWALAKPLACEDLPTLAGTYRTRFFLAVAFAEAIALVAFVVSINTGRWELYWLLLPVTLFGLARAAPTPAKLQAAQEALRGTGCHLSLVKALRGTSTS